MTQKQLTIAEAEYKRLVNIQDKARALVKSLAGSVAFNAEGSAGDRHERALIKALNVEPVDLEEDDFAELKGN